MLTADYFRVPIAITLGVVAGVLLISMAISAALSGAPAKLDCSAILAMAYAIMEIACRK